MGWKQESLIRPSVRVQQLMFKTEIVKGVWNALTPEKKSFTDTQNKQHRKLAKQQEKGEWRHVGPGHDRRSMWLGVREIVVCSCGKTWVEEKKTHG